MYHKHEYSQVQKIGVVFIPPRSGQLFFLLSREECCAGLPTIGPRLGVELLTVETVPLNLERVNNSPLVLVELNRPTTDVSLEFHLPQE